MKKWSVGAIAAAGVMSGLGAAAPAYAQSDDQSDMARVFMTGNNFCPRGSLAANGATLSIASYNALYSLLGTVYGGDGISTFGLPDLRGRVPIGSGASTTGNFYTLGQRAGTTSTTMTISTMPAHIHIGQLRAMDIDASVTSPVRAALGRTPGRNTYTTSTAGTAYLNAATVQMDSAGGSQAFAIRNPYLGVQYCILISGYYPSRP